MNGDQAEPLRQIVREQTMKELAELLARPSMGKEETDRLDMLRDRLQGDIVVYPIRKNMK